MTTSVGISRPPAPGRSGLALGRSLLGAGALVAVWELVAYTIFGRNHLVPPLQDVIVTVFHDPSFEMWPNVVTTVKEAATGFLCGNMVAIGLALAFVQVPVARKGAAPAGPRHVLHAHHRHRPDPRDPALGDRPTEHPVRLVGGFHDAYRVPRRAAQRRPASAWTWCGSTAGAVGAADEGPRACCASRRLRRPCHLRAGLCPRRHRRRVHRRLTRPRAGHDQRQRGHQLAPRFRDSPGGHRNRRRSLLRRLCCRKAAHPVGTEAPGVPR